MEFKHRGAQSVILTPNQDLKLGTAANASLAITLHIPTARAGSRDRTVCGTRAGASRKGSRPSDFWICGVDRLRWRATRQRLLAFFLMLSGGAVLLVARHQSAALLAAHGTIMPPFAAMGAVLATAVSVLINLVIPARISRDTSLTRHLTWSLTTLAALGVIGMLVQNFIMAAINRL